MFETTSAIALKKKYICIYLYRLINITNNEHSNISTSQNIGSLLVKPVF